MNARQLPLGAFEGTRESFARYAIANMEIQKYQCLMSLMLGKGA